MRVTTVIRTHCCTYCIYSVPILSTTLRTHLLYHCCCTIPGTWYIFAVVPAPTCCTYLLYLLHLPLYVLHVPTAGVGITVLLLQKKKTKKPCTVRRAIVSGGGWRGLANRWGLPPAFTHGLRRVLDGSCSTPSSISPFYLPNYEKT